MGGLLCGELCANGLELSFLDGLFLFSCEFVQLLYAGLHHFFILAMLLQHFPHLRTHSLSLTI